MVSVLSNGAIWIFGENGENDHVFKELERFQRIEGRLK
jgi:hypothetical protein